jgi:hypothetical protein
MKPCVGFLAMIVKVVTTKERDKDEIKQMVSYRGHLHGGHWFGQYFVRATDEYGRSGVIVCFGILVTIPYDQ